MSGPAVAAVGVGDRFVGRLRREGVDVVVVDDADGLLALVASRRVSTVVIAAADEAVVAEVRRLRRVDESVPIVVAAADTVHPQVAGAIRIDPFVGRATYCVPAGDEQVFALVADHSRRELKRRTHADTMRRVVDNQLPGLLALPAVTSQYLGQLLEHATIGVVTVDPAGSIRGWNPRAEAITGRRTRDAIGVPLAALFPTVDGPRLRAVLDRAAASPEAVTEVMARTGPNGSEQHLELTVASIDDGLGRLGTLVLIQDVTQRLRAEMELADRARTAALAADIGRALTSLAPLDVQLNESVQALVDHLDAAFARIWTLDPSGETLVLRASAGMYRHLDGPHSRVPVGHLKIGRIGATRRPHLTNDVLNDPHIGDPDWARREGMVAFAGYPLVLGDQLVGVMAIFARQPLREVTLTALASVADTIAVGIEQADNSARVEELLEREREARKESEQALDRYVALARTLQQSLLPPTLPDIPGVEVSARYHWAGRGDVVGGDFYDVFSLRDGRHCLVIGDVSGKGVEAASMTALARHTLRTAARIHADPAAVLAMLNDIVCERGDDDRFCTVALVAVDPDPPGGWRLSVTNAGHVLPIHLTGDGRVREVGEPGLPIGLFRHAVATEYPVAVRPGDALVLFTDGVSEARSPTGDFHPGLIDEVIRSHPGASAARLAEELESAVVRLEAGHLRDDVTILAARFADPCTMPQAHLGRDS